METWSKEAIHTSVPFKEVKLNTSCQRSLKAFASGKAPAKSAQALRTACTCIMLRVKFTAEESRERSQAWSVGVLRQRGRYLQRRPTLDM